MPTTMPPPPDDVYDARLYEMLAMIRPYVWHAEIEEHHPAAPDTPTQPPRHS